MTERIIEAVLAPMVNSVCDMVGSRLVTEREVARTLTDVLDVQIPVALARHWMDLLKSPPKRAAKINVEATLRRAVLETTQEARQQPAQPDPLFKGSHGVGMMKLDDLDAPPPTQGHVTPESLASYGGLADDNPANPVNGFFSALESTGMARPTLPDGKPIR